MTTSEHTCRCPVCGHTHDAPKTVLEELRELRDEVPSDAIGFMVPVGLLDRAIGELTKRDQSLKELHEQIRKKLRERVLRQDDAPGEKLRSGSWDHNWVD